jgi:predicted transcriptional regulator
MDGDDDPVTAVEFLARSEARVRILDALADAGPLGTAALRDRLDASRTTIGRNLTALSERGWIASGNRTHEITTAGRWILEDFTALTDTVRDASRFAPVFECIDPSTLGFDLRAHEFEITTADPADPLKMVHRHVAKVRAAAEIRAVLPLAGAQAMRAAHDRLDDGGAEMTLVVSPQVATAFRSDPAYGEYLSSLRATESVTIAVYDGEIPYYLGLFADTVEFGFDDDGQPTALLETDADAVYEWVESEFETYHEAATPLDDWPDP